MTTATIQTIDTPDGAFTIARRRAGARARLGLDRRRPRRVLARIAPAAAPRSARHEGETDAAAAVRAYYAGDLAAIDAVEVAQRGTAMQLAGGRRCAASRRARR